jgi:two-component system OmpR family sensor kinase
MHAASQAQARIAVSCECEAQQARPKIKITVADNGRGVAPEECARIFKRFYRAPGAGGRGSGIGLSLVASIAELYSSDIRKGAGLDGRGFSVSVCFPARAS